MTTNAKKKSVSFYFPSGKVVTRACQIERESLKKIKEEIRKENIKNKIRKE